MLKFEPYSPAVVKWRPGATTQDKTKCQLMAYVDARDAMAALDGQPEIASWSDVYRVIDPEEKAVEATITVVLKNGTTISRSDVGYPNDEGDEKGYKGAFSDAFKRATVKIGAGRELYAIKLPWAPYDAQKKKPTVLPEYVPGRGWVLPSGGNVSQNVSSEQARPATATDGMKRKLMATFNEKGLKSAEDRKAFTLATVGKYSSKDLTPQDVDKLLAALEEFKGKVEE